jgi:predicted ATPase
MCLGNRGGDRIAEAEVRLLQAIETSEQQGALSFELRAATNLGRLWRDQNRYSEAHNLVSKVYNRFTEGFDTSDLKDARALLDELS